MALSARTYTYSRPGDERADVYTQSVEQTEPSCLTRSFPPQARAQPDPPDTPGGSSSHFRKSGVK